jgi:type IV secretion system protein VirD4
MFKTLASITRSQRGEEKVPKGLYLGRHYNDATKQADDVLRYAGERHLLIFGPNGSGKGMRLLAPNLLSGLADRSMIVIDPKGELAAITADHRRKLGHDVVIINPFNMLGLGSAGFNPMSVLDAKSPNFFDDAAAIGEALIKISGHEPHWTESARTLVTALCMWEKFQKGAKANLENVRAMLTEPDEWVPAVRQDGKEYLKQVAGLRVTARKMVRDGGFEIESLAGRFTEDNKEISGIRSSADTQTQWLLSPQIRDDLKKDGVDFGNLKKRPTTVYVILPAERLRTHSVWLRLIVVSALRALYKPGGLRTFMIIDEAAALDHLAPLEDALGIVRGYRVQIATIFQDLNQLKAIYKDRWETFIANAGAVLGFAPNDLTTAKWMSERTGQTTFVAKGYSSNSGFASGKDTSVSGGSGASAQQIARPLLFPHDLFGLEEGTGLLWLAGLSNTTKFFAPNHWEIQACAGRAKPNPFYEPDNEE